AVLRGLGAGNGPRLLGDVIKVASPVLRRGRASNRSSLFGEGEAVRPLLYSSRNGGFMLE
ncbi:MAG: hypothetical protein K8R34_15980, partial [Methanosarcinales archaeon]|nr:hypothetical protein [Methanosarcinales archaeon]